MKKINVSLTNCHGIRELNTTLDYTRKNAVSVYAPNGTMKTSFARTFRDVVAGIETRDDIFPDRTTTRSFTDENGNDLVPEDVVVILSYDEELGPTEATSNLLVHPELRKEYDELQLDLFKVRDELVAALKAQSGTKQEISSLLSLAFTKEADNFFNALIRVVEEVQSQELAPFAEVPYDLIFNDKVAPLLRKAEFQSSLGELVGRLNELLDESNFFSRDTFNYYNASNVTKSLGDNGFFQAQHALLLHGADGEPVEVTDGAELEDLISSEKKRISDDAALSKKLESIEKQLNRNVNTREFFSYIQEHVELLPELTNIDLFEEKVWKSYLKVNEDLYLQVVTDYRATEQRKREIEKQAAVEHTQWERVIDIFNDRFFVPFKLTAKNRNKVVLGQERILQLGFEFDDGVEHAPVERADLLRVLSDGEKKALYILNVLFEVETRKGIGRDTLFVIDDLADSFDYKNKYAIIHYLKEMSEIPNFRLLILTHNFDFFRTVLSRHVVDYKHCLMAQKSDDRVLLAQAQGVKNPFINDFKGRFFDDGMKRVASIPFVRNIAEYTKGEGDPDYLALTSLLHWKEDSSSISHADLDGIFKGIFLGDGDWSSPNGLVLDLIFSEASNALQAPEGINFEHKIVLSIAIRLKAEIYMVDKIADGEATSAITASQTQKLYQMFSERGHGTAEERAILDSVVLMTPENLHVNSFMYEPIIDMSDAHLRKLYQDVLTLT